jgi:hypothetical protein
VDQYAALGFNALAITDHDLVTAQKASAMVAIQGCECSQAGHIGSLFCNYTRGEEEDPQSIINGIVAAGGIAILNHPQYMQEQRAGEPVGHPYENCINYTGYTGIEVYSNCPVPSSVKTWDLLLSTTSKQVWGFGASDTHIDPSAIPAATHGAITAFVSENTEAAIKAALQSGCFIVNKGINTGVTLSLPTISNTDGDNIISLSCSGATKIRFIGNGGRTLYEIASSAGSYLALKGDRYVRIEVEKNGSIVAYYQPIFLID